MSKKHYDEASAIRAVSKKNCNVLYGNKCIEVIVNSVNSPGNGTWGKIDYLCHYCGWHWTSVKEFSKNKKL